MPRMIRSAADLTPESVRSMLQALTEFGYRDVREADVRAAVDAYARDEEADGIIAMFVYGFLRDNGIEPQGEE